MSRSRLRALAIVFSLLLGVLSNGATAAAARATFNCDAPTIARVDVHDAAVADAAAAQLRAAREAFTSTSSAGRGASTTSSRSIIATNTADEFAGIKPGSSGGPSAGKPFSQAVRQEELANNPSTCVYCHMETDAPQIDHAIPRVQGGNATIENAQTTCGWCNASKGGRSFPVNPPPGYEGLWPPPWWNSGG